MENDVFKNDHKVSNLSNQVHYVALDSNGNDPVRNNFDELKKKKRIFCLTEVILHLSGDVEHRCEVWADQGLATLVSFEILGVNHHWLRMNGLEI